MRTVKETGLNKIYILLLVITALIGGSFPLTAQNVGDIWETVHYLEGLPFRTISNNGSLFVAIGDDGLCMTSSDGKNWALRNTGTRKNLYGSRYCNNQFIAVGYEGAIVTSPTGTSWTVRTSNVSVGLWGVAYGNGIYVAVGLDGMTSTSTDGVTWTSRFSGTTKPYKEIAFGNGRFVAVGNAGMIRSSTDGINWTDQSVGGAYNLLSVNYANGLWLIGGAGGTVYSSTNGTSWTKRTTNVLNHLWQCTYVDGNYWFAGAKEGTEKLAPVIKSSDGINWIRIYTKSSSNLRGISGMGNKLVAVGDRRTIQFSDDTPVPDLTVFSPNGGEKLIGGGSTTISWKNSGPSMVKIEYSLNAGSSWTTIVESTPNDGAYTWSVPSIATTTGRVRVSDEADGSPSDASNANFSILVASTETITLTSPNGGETLGGGEDWTIRWTGSRTFDTIDIEFYDGSAWNVVVTGTADTGSYNWTVPENVSTEKGRIWIKGWSSAGNPTDYTDNYYTIVPGSDFPTIEITSPNGGEVIAGGSFFDITWSDNRTFTRIDIEYYDGSKWNVIVNNAEDEDHYLWTVPNVVTDKARLWIKGYDQDNNPTDYTDATFTITTPPDGNITVTAPNGGEGLRPGAATDITWTSSGNVAKSVALYYSTDGGKNWTTITGSTSNDSAYSWTTPNVISDNCLVKVTDINNGLISDISDNKFSIGGDPEITLNRSRLNFGSLPNGRVTAAQTLLLSNNGTGVLNWTVSTDVNWITVNPGSGNGDAILSVSVNPAGMGIGEHTGNIVITSTNAVNSPQTIPVYLYAKQTYQDQAPVGLMEKPDNGKAGVSGAIAVSGWALDDIDLDSVKLYRVVNGGLSYLDDAVFVDGARPDVEAAMPTYPNASRAGWGYMLLTNFLPEGELVLTAIAKDITGYQVVLGTMTIYLDHQNANLPFGAIDNPFQGGSASGNVFINNGWVLTPNPKSIPADGSTINVYIDGQYQGKVNYNLYRADIAKFFPNYANTNGAGANFVIDTTKFANGVYAISWGVVDSSGVSAGIGSRFFTIVNTNNRSAGNSVSRPNAGNITVSNVMKNRHDTAKTAAFKKNPISIANNISRMPSDISTPISLKKGFNQDAGVDYLLPETVDGYRFEIKPMERFEIGFDGRCVSAYRKVGDQLLALPLGSSLNADEGKFFWQPGAGFKGDFHLIFIVSDSDGYLKKKDIQVSILPN